MIKWLGTLWARWLARRPKGRLVTSDGIEAPDAIPAEPIPDLSAPVTPVTASRKRTKRKAAIDPIHVTDVLDMIPKCREMLPILRKAEPEAADFWSIFGAKLVAGSLFSNELKFDEPASLPGLGMLFWYNPDWAKEDLMPGHFMYFSKLKKQPYYAVVPNSSETMFRMTQAYTDHEGLVYVYDYFVSVNHDAGVQVVSQRNLTQHNLPRGGSFTRLEWGLPPRLIMHFNDIRRRHPGMDIGRNPQEFGVQMFRMTLGYHDKAAEDFQVRAEQHGSSVAFNVALGRTPQFFKDRETGLAADGKRKRIFHAVAEHTRELADGRTSVVPAHYRGERKFLWNGERITITPAERSFAKTFRLEGELTDDAVIPKGLTSIVNEAPRLRTVTESEWRKNLR